MLTEIISELSAVKRRFIYYFPLFLQCGSIFTMKKIYFLSTCSSCKRIMRDLGTALDVFEKIDIKLRTLTFNEIDQMRDIAGSYEAIFSKRAIKYKALKDESLQESDYRKLIHDEYTFLKRPLCIVDEQIFIGNRPQNILALKVHLTKG